MYLKYTEMRVYIHTYNGHNSRIRESSIAEILRGTVLLAHLNLELIKKSRTKESSGGGSCLSSASAASVGGRVSPWTHSPSVVGSAVVLPSGAANAVADLDELASGHVAPREAATASDAPGGEQGAHAVQRGKAFVLEVQRVVGIVFDVLNEAGSASVVPSVVASACVSRFVASAIAHDGSDSLLPSALKGPQTRSSAPASEPALE